MPDQAARRKIRVLIVDDEPVALRGACHVLKSHPDVHVVGECRNGIEAIQAIRTLGPDVVFLDIQMPGKDGFEVIRDIGPDRMPSVIFVTAHDAYAVRAFEAAAVDYVVKPYTDARLLDALSRAYHREGDRCAAIVHGQLLALLQAQPRPAPAAAVPAACETYLSRLLVNVGARTIVVDVDDVAWIQAADYCVSVYAGASVYVLRQSLDRLESQLDPMVFVRVHRSALVRMAAVTTIDRSVGDRLALVLRNGVRVPVSRSRRASVLTALGGLRG